MMSGRNRRGSIQGRRRGAAVERLEPKRLFPGSSAIDRLDFGNLASEAAHRFEPGAAVTVSAIPEPSSAALIFTTAVAVSATRRNTTRRRT